MRSPGILAPRFLGIFYFACFPSGSCQPPVIFTKILKPLEKSRRSQGIAIAIFLDYGLGGGADRVQAKINSFTVHADLLKSGFVPNEETEVPFGSPFKLSRGLAFIST